MSGLHNIGSRTASVRSFRHSSPASRTRLELPQRGESPLGLRSAPVSPIRRSLIPESSPRRRYSDTPVSRQNSHSTLRLRSTASTSTSSTCSLSSIEAGSDSSNHSTASSLQTLSSFLSSTSSHIFQLFFSQVGLEGRSGLCVRSSIHLVEAGMAASYGSIGFQMHESTREAAGGCQFVYKALKIISRTVASPSWVTLPGTEVPDGTAHWFLGTRKPTGYVKAATSGGPENTAYTLALGPGRHAKAFRFGMTVLLTVILVVPFLMIVMGVQYLHECPLEVHIPIYLLVGGCFGFLKFLWLLCRQVRSRQYEHIDDEFAEDGLEEMFSSTSYKATDIALSGFLVIWFGLGNFWVVNIYPPNFETSLWQPNAWCSKTVYIFTVVQLFFVHTVIACFILLCFCLCCGQKCAKLFGNSYK